MDSSERDAVDYIIGRELLALAEQVLTPREQEILYNYLHSRRRKRRISSWLQRILQKLRSAYESGQYR